MIRLSVPLACFALIGMLPAPASAQTPDKPAPEQAPVCIYNSKSYSDGAYVCARRSLMQKCVTDGGKAAWTVVEDKDLAAKCRASATRGTVYQQRARWHRQNIRKQITPPG